MDPKSGVAVGTDGERMVEQVRDRYGRIALGVENGCCGNSLTEQAVALGIGYSSGELAEIPVEANLGLGCGAPI